MDNDLAQALLRAVAIGRPLTQEELAVCERAVDHATEKDGDGDWLHVSPQLPVVARVLLTELRRVNVALSRAQYDLELARG